MPKKKPEPDYYKGKVKDIYGKIYMYYYYYMDYEGDPNYYENHILNNPNQTTITNCFQERGDLIIDDPHGVAYKWNGIPVHTNHNDKVQVYAIIIYFLSGVLIWLLSLTCIRLLYKNSALSKAMKFMFIFDESCKILSGVFDFYCGSCVWTWNCVQTEGFLPGILVNQILTALTYEKSELINHGVSIIRPFAALFDGKFYGLAEQFAMPYCFIITGLAVFFKMIQIGHLTQANTDYFCYTGYYFSPIDLTTITWYSRGWVIFEMDNVFIYMEASLLALSLFADLIIIYQILKISRGSSNQKRRALIKISIMVIAINVVWTAWDFFQPNTFAVFIRDWKTFHMYLFYQGLHFFGNSITSLIKIVFNLPERSKMISSVSPNSTQSTNTSSRITSHA